jgi:hypothetical protein
MPPPIPPGLHTTRPKLHLHHKNTSSHADDLGAVGYPAKQSVIPVIKRFPGKNQAVSLDSYRKTPNYRHNGPPRYHSGPVCPTAPYSHRKAHDLMPNASKHDLVYFESPSMRSLYEDMNEWQRDNDRALFSVSIQRDGGNYCAIAVAGPTEVTVTNAGGNRHAVVSENGRLFVYASEYS